MDDDVAPEVACHRGHGEVTKHADLARSKFGSVEQNQISERRERWCRPTRKGDMGMEAAVAFSGDSCRR